MSKAIRYEFKCLSCDTVGEAKAVNEMRAKNALGDRGWRFQGKAMLCPTHGGGHVAVKD